MANEVAINITAKDMTGPAFASAKGEAKEYGNALEGVGEGADRGEQRILGLKDSVDGVATVMQGPGKQGLAAYIQGWADIASGLANFVIPAIIQVATAEGRQAVATVASTVAQKAAATATKAWAAVQWVLNAALSANPIGLVIAAVVALVAAFVIAYKRSETFRAVVQGSLKAVQAAASALLRGFKAAMEGIARVASATWSAIKRGASLLASGLKVYASAITAPYRAAFAGIRAAWNSTLGGRSFSFPGWVPGIGGKGFTIPRLATGGVGGGLTIAGERGMEMINLPHGSMVRSHPDTQRLMGQSGGSKLIQVNLNVDGKTLTKVIIDPLRETVRTQGRGNVQGFLGA